MPSLGSASKSKSKSKEARQRSRHTTPSSVVSASATINAPPTTTPFLQLDTSKLLVTGQPSYAEILDRLETKPAQLEPRTLQTIIEELKQLSDHAEKRAESCERALRLIYDQIKDAEAAPRLVEQGRRSKAKKEETVMKNGEAKKRKDRTEVADSDMKREDDVPPAKIHRSSSTSGPADSPSPPKKVKHSPGTSSLSDVAESPKAEPQSEASPARSDVSMEENRVLHQPVVPPQGYFPDPLGPDPVIYHIREITPDMSEQEKKEIYSVASYPTVDLSGQIAGTPPDKDFSNAKPAQQITFNTFSQFAEPYVRPLAEEDMAFLRERGDRVTPFLAIPRSKKSWKEIWDEEDGQPVSDGFDRVSTSQPRGSLDLLDENNVNSDQISSGPLASRLLSLLKFEHRSPPNDANGHETTFTDGNDTMDLDGLMNGTDSADKPVQPATSISDLVSNRNLQKLDYVQSDERIKAELRYLGLLNPDENPDFDVHHDDDISERLRLLQAELRRVMIVNAARKARLADLAKARLAYQEYSTILDDLDSQVQQAYLKRTRTLGKTKKGGPGGHKPKPGSISSAAIGVSRARDIGDNARMLMERRKKWQTCLGVPLFKDLKTSIPGPKETIWEKKLMESYEKAELEAMEEEGE